MSVTENVESTARKARRRVELKDLHKTSSLRTILPVLHLRRKNLVFPYPSEIFPTEYNQRLPEWRRRVCRSAQQASHWSNWKEYQLAALGAVLGLSNVMYFPYNAMINGRGAYVFAYVIITFLIGFPILFLQLALGQFTSKGTVQVFQLVPLSQGIGISFLLQSLITIVRCSVQYSWVFYFMVGAFYFQFSPFKWELPWGNCLLSEYDIEHMVGCGQFSLALFKINDTTLCPAKYYQ